MNPACGRTSGRPTWGMKFVVVIEYNGNTDQIGPVGPRHHDYLRGLLFAAGPSTGKAGASWIYEAETLEQADNMIRNDPYHAAGMFST